MQTGDLSVVVPSGWPTMNDLLGSSPGAISGLTRSLRVAATLAIRNGLRTGKLRPVLADEMPVAVLIEPMLRKTKGRRLPDCDSSAGAEKVLLDVAVREGWLDSRHDGPSVVSSVTLWSAVWGKPTNW